jgi:hypothetical protein
MIPAVLRSPDVLAAVLVVGGAGAIWSLSSWVKGLNLLILAVLFGGILGARLGSGALPIALRDAMIVLPIYAAFLASGAWRDVMSRLPGGLALTLSLVLAWLVIELFNPTTVSGLQLAIGLKVWALYLPFLAIGTALAMRPAGLVKFFRFFLLCGSVACGIGLVQSFLIRIIGYEPAISLFFGPAARAVTQGFAYFSEAGGVYRVPGTFSFTSQYVGFLYLFLTVAMIETNADPSPRYRLLGQAGVFLALLAGLLSGTKGALVTFPVFVVGYFFLGLLRSRLLVAAPIVMGLGAVAVAAIGVSVGGLFTFGVGQAERYGNTFIAQQIGDAVRYGAFGNGIGSSTNAARYVATGLVNLTGFESYYAKIAAELGSIGLVVFAAFFSMAAAHTVVVTARHRLRSSVEIVGPLAVYLLFTLVSGLKGPVLDVDPANIFFWLALGLMLGIDLGVRQPSLVRQGALAIPALSGGGRGAVPSPR